MDIILFLELILFVVLMGFSAFFSSSETSLFSLDKLQLEQMRKDNHPRIELIERLLASPRRLIISILIGNELVNVTASVISAAMIITVFGADSKWINLLIMVPILLLFGEITPKTLAIRNNVAFATAESRPIEIFSNLIKPIRILVRIVSERIITLIVGSEVSRGNIITEDMVKILAREAVGEGTLDHEEAMLIEQIFDFSSKTVEDVMTLRSDISFIDIEMPLDKVMKEYRRSKHSKMPVYQDTRDRVLGFIYIRDLLGFDLKKLGRQKQPLKRFLREAYFVPETKPAAELFETFKERKMSIALTVDEFGGVTGLVTMEDLLEVIFGDIHSEADSHPVHRISEKEFEVDGMCEISKFNVILNTKLSSKHAETVAGLILHLYGELPPEGASVVYKKLNFKVMRVEDNRITQVIVELLEPNKSEKKAAKPKKSVLAAGSVDPGQKGGTEQPDNKNGQQSH